MPSGRIRAIVLLSVAELLAMGLWFGVSSVSPQIAAEWQLTPAATTWLTIAVQIGFVAGTLAAAVFNLPDILRPSRLFVVSAAAAAIANTALALFVSSIEMAVAIRFLTGVFLAGVYPPAMKIVATWFRSGRGIALGILVGALTIGKASPYLVNTLGLPGWREAILLASLLALAGGGIVLFFVREGPFDLGRAPFDARQALEVFRNRGVRLANFGYFGHMWELYAMWAWAPVMIRSSLLARGDDPLLAEVASFAVLGAGGIGCVVAGAIADRVGRTVVTSWALAISGLCSATIGLFYGGPSLLLVAIAALWGASVVADSAQFSACVTELGDPRYIGTALTLQTSLGFLLTTLSIGVIPWAVDLAGWRWAFLVLVPGPIFGIASMLRLRQLPESLKIANGRR
jgi:MFS family permease